MSVFLDFLKGISEKLGIPSTVLFVPFSLVALCEALTFYFTNNSNLYSFTLYTPIGAIFIYFFLYFLIHKLPQLKKLRINKIKDETKLIKISVFYSVLSLFVSSIMVTFYINEKNIRYAQELEHVSDNLGIAIANIDYIELSEKNNNGYLDNIIDNGLIQPLNQMFQQYYSKELPRITKLPAELPQSLQASFMGDTEKDYSVWAKEKGYNLAIYGQAQQGISDKIFLDMNFDVLDEDKTVKSQKSVFKLYYTVSNYDNDTLLASFDNMIK